MAKEFLLNTDCIQFMKSLPDESIDLIVTDPPYPIRPRGHWAGSTYGGMMKECEDGAQLFDSIPDITEYLPEFYRVLKQGTNCYIMTNNYNIVRFLKEIDKSKFKFSRMLIWDKQNKICGSYYMSQFEYVIMLRKGKARKINNCGSSDIISIANKKQKGTDGKSLHNTEKPQGLYEFLIGNSCNEGDWVLEPFAGIGNVIPACANLNRNLIACELEEKYYNTARTLHQQYLTERR
jgi:site-specific DNA-methyltransferase (adenine-specific)